MKKTLWLAIILVLVALFSLPLAFLIVDSQRESVVITEEVISGVPKAAEDVTLEFLTHWDSHALWDTKYTIGTGETVTEFTFEGDGMHWPREESEYVEFNVPINFGTAMAVGDDVYAGKGVGVNLDDTWIPEVLYDVAERTKAGETHTEILSLSDYYEYYPLELSVRSEQHNMSFYSNGVDYFSKFFHVEIPPEEKITVTITKNAAGIVTAVDCNSQIEGGISFDKAYAFGEDGLFLTYACTDWETGERIDAGEKTGIFYGGYVEENRRFTIPGDVVKVCDIPTDIVPAEMLWDEEQNELYLAAKAGKEYRLYIYEVAGTELSLKQELIVLVRGKLPYYREMTLENGGVLLKWSDGSFSFVAEKNGSYELWCSNTFIPNVTYLEEAAETGQPVELGYPDEIFHFEHALLFDGERLVLASYDSWDSVNVTLAVYNRKEQIYCGRYHHSAELDWYLAGNNDRIYVQGSTIGNNRRKQVAEPLKVWAK